MKIQDAKLTFGGLDARSTTRRIVVHHAEASTASPADIQRWHLANGWSGAGYHFLVRKDGSVWALRPEWAVGAHAQGSNSDSIGVCFEGNFNNETMGTTQLEAGRELVSHLKAKYGISTVQRHRDVSSTDCPGAKFPFDELVNGKAVPVATAPNGTVAMYRMYNPNSGEHHYTASHGEAEALRMAGWGYEGIGWYAPAKSATPVHRLYNPNAGDHHYTTSVNERDSLVNAGWKYEGVGWYSDDTRRVPVYRLYNPNAHSGSHHWTSSKGEYDSLVRSGWKGEGIGFYAAS